MPFSETLTVNVDPVCCARSGGSKPKLAMPGPVDEAGTAGRGVAGAGGTELGAGTAAGAVGDEVASVTEMGWLIRRNSMELAVPTEMAFSFISLMSWART